MNADPKKRIFLLFCFLPVVCVFLFSLGFSRKEPMSGIISQGAGFQGLFPSTARSVFQIKNDLREGFFIASPWKISQTLELPDKTVLYFGYGRLRSKFFDRFNHVRLKVYAHSKGGSHILFDKEIPANLWGNAAIDLNDFDGGKITLTFQISSTLPMAKVFISAPGACPKNNPQRPNVILIALDALRADHLGCYGYSRPTSPAIDNLASQGVIFENANSQASWTLPSFSSIFTGLYPSKHGANDVGKKLQDRRSLMARMMQENGYYTGAFYGGGFLEKEFGLNAGFYSYRKRNGFIKTSWPDETVLQDWLETRRHVPLFLFIHTYDAHEPYGKLPVSYRSLFTDPDYTNPHRLESKLAAEIKDPGTLSQQDIDYMKGLYDGGIRFVDDQISKLIELLKKLNLHENTYFVIFSDHGEEFLDHGGLGHGSRLNEETTHVPMIFSGPGLQKRKRVAELVETVDLLPTLMELLPLNGPSLSHFDGKSLYGFLRSGESPVWSKEFAIGEFTERFKYSIRNKDWCYMRAADGKKEFLFDRIKDRAERTNLAAQYPEVCRQMESAYHQITAKKEENTASEDITPDPQTVESLRSLGYL